MLQPDPVVSLQDNNFASLAHGQLIQALLVELLTNYPELCPHYDEFRRRNANAPCVVQKDESTSPELFTRQLIELTGNQQLNESVRIQHVDVWRTLRQDRQSIGGSPREWLDTLAGFIEVCFPRTHEEWLYLAEHAYAKSETQEYVKLITALVIQSMGCSDQAGLVPFNIKAVERENPTLAFAVCMTWLTQFLALTELAWPAKDEVNDFASLNQLSAAANESQHTNLAIMQMFHRCYLDLRDQRACRENPFAFMVRKKLDSPLNNSVLHPEINADGVLVAIRQIKSAESSLLQNGNDQGANSFGTGGIDERPQNRDARSKSRKATVTERDRAEVLAAIRAHKSNFNGEEPSPTALRKALRGRHVSSDKLTPILNELRETGEYKTPRRYRG